MAENFEAAVEDGLRLSKRIYFGKDRAVAPPKPLTAMERDAGCSSLPSSPMLYAVIVDPAIVDNPDMPSYQPHVHGRCDPPALIPLQMNGVSLEVDCFLDTAFVTVSGTWRVHCIMGSRRCDCRIAVPMGEQGSILGVEVEVPRRSYGTEFITVDNEKGSENVPKAEGGGFIKAHIFTLTIPQVDGGTNISVKMKWSQKLTYNDGQYTLRVPFSFPEYVTPAAKKISKREKIELKVDAGSETEVLCKTTSHPLKERHRQAGKLGFLYDSEVLTWSSSDFMFTYTVSSSHTFGAVLLNPPLLGDVDRRDTFYCYLFPGKQQSGKVFRKEVVFVVDISESMRGQPLEETKNALFAALAKLDDPKDMFNVIAFNGESHLLSSVLEPATAENIENAIQWINSSFVASGGTNILLPLNQAVKMLSDNSNSIPIVFLITDGAVEDERNICNTMTKQLRNYKNICPRIYTLGIGKFCNHYFLRMLALISRGHYGAASDVECIEARMELFARASSIFLADIAFQNLEKLDDVEVFPSQIPDLSSESPLIISGRYRGTFPETIKVIGRLAEMKSFTLDLKMEEAKEMPIGKMAAKQQIELLTAQAWLSENQELEKKIAKMSVQNTVVSEYTNMVLLETEKGKPTADSTNAKKASRKVDLHHKEEPKPRAISTMHNLGLGFGNLSATAENIPSGYGDRDHLDGADAFARAACGCCGRCWRHCCCMCCIQCCSRMNDQCLLAFTQLFGALACLGCYSCCCAGKEG